MSLRIMVQGNPSPHACGCQGRPRCASKPYFAKSLTGFAGLCYFEFTPAGSPRGPGSSHTRSRSRAVITGFNTDIPFEGVTYHVQTEDKGLDTPLILSLVYVGGAIIASKRTPYEDLIGSGFDEKVLTERLQRQHKLICAAIKAGRVEDLKRMSGANGDTAQTEDAQTAGSTGKSKRKKSAAAQQRAEAEAAAEESAVKGKAAEVKAGKAKSVEETPAKDESSAVEETKAAPAQDASENRKSADSSTSQPFGLDLLTNLVDEIDALGDTFQTRPAGEQETLDELVTTEERDELMSAVVAEDEPEPLKVEPLPFTLRGAPTAAEAGPPEELYLSLLDDEGDFRAGQLATIKVHVGRGVYGRSPVVGAAVTVKVLGTTFRPLILTTDTDERGLAIIRALLPRFHSGRAALIIRATSGEEFSELRRIIHQ